MRIGFVGTGSIAARHLAALEREGAGDVTIAAHLGRRPERAEVAAARFGGVGYTDLEAFIGEGRPDAVVVTLPPAEHGAIEVRLIAAGIPLLIEKPLGLDRETPDRIARQARESGVLLAAGYNWRAFDTLGEVRRMLAETPARMVMGRFHIGTPPAPWWRFNALSGGQMVEQACHLVDLARHLVGEAQLLGAAGSFGPLPGVTDGDVAGASAALLRFGEAPGVITATCVLPDGPGAELRLICLGREIVITLAGVTVIEGQKMRQIESRSSSYVQQDRAFFEAVRTGDTTGVYARYEDALVTHRLCLDIAEAITSGSSD